MDNLQRLEKELQRDLRCIDYPPPAWLPPTESLDVIVIGAGMAGLCVAFALFRLGISRIRILDAAPAGYEGPWATYAKMLTLRSTKNLEGPALGQPRLTFCSWFTAQYGEHAWNSLYKIPTLQWMEYLRWYRKVLNLPVTNNAKVETLHPQPQGFLLQLSDRTTLSTKKVILATGRAGFGGTIIPLCMDGIPKNYFAHTSEQIDFRALKDKRVLILGAGASGFDAAAEALEQGAVSAIMLSRRASLPQVNKFADTVYPGFAEGYYLLPDATKIAIMENAEQAGTPPPFETLDRLQKQPHFSIIQGFDVLKVKIEAGMIHLTSSCGSISGDYLILATGFAIDGTKEPLCAPFINQCLLWKDKYPQLKNELGRSPYLGDHFQFKEKVVGEAPYLRHIYCFNYAATFSQGGTSGDIPMISVGAKRLARGIASDFFVEQGPVYQKRFEDYSEIEFDPSNYGFLKHPFELFNIQP